MAGFIWIIIVTGGILFLLIAYLFGRLQGQKRTNVQELPPDLLTLYQEMQALPGKVLASIQGSINPQKGKVAELLTYAELRNEYDVIIPLGQPFDFLGIKYNEKIDFIEVKTEKSQLSVNEKAISALIQNSRVYFRLLVIQDKETGTLVKALSSNN